MVALEVLTASGLGSLVGVRHALLGSIGGMAVLSGVLGWPLARFGSRRKVRRAVSLAVGVISTGLGLYWGYPLAARMLD